MRETDWKSGHARYKVHRKRMQGTKITRQYSQKDPARYKNSIAKFTKREHKVQNSIANLTKRTCEVKKSIAKFTKKSMQGTKIA